METKLTRKFAGSLAVGDNIANVGRVIKARLGSTTVTVVVEAGSFREEITYHNTRALVIDHD